MNLTPNEYQKLAGRTLIDNLPREYSKQEIFLAWNALGLTGEAGEVADCIKKMVFHDHGLNVEELEKELGDVCWYLAAIASKLGIDLETIMNKNIEKLKKRYPNGFSPADSLNESLNRR